MANLFSSVADQFVQDAAVLQNGNATQVLNIKEIEDADSMNDQIDFIRP